jgi:hypothetical protein
MAETATCLSRIKSVKVEEINIWSFLWNFMNTSPVLPPNGLRYPLVGGTRERQFDGINFKAHKLLENAQTPTSRVHAVLGAFISQQIFQVFGVKCDAVRIL